MKGSCRKQGEDSYELRATVNGFPWRETFHGTEEEAMSYLDDKLHEFKHGLNPAQSNVDIEHYFEYWDKNYVLPQLKHTTRRGYKETIKNHILTNMSGTTKLKDLTPLHIEQLYNKLRDKGASPNIMRDVHTVWGSSLERAYIWGFIPEKFKLDKLEPVTRKDRIRLKAAKKEKIVWNADQAMDFLVWSWKKSGRRFYLYLIAFTTGIRRGENLALKWDNILFDDRRIKIAASITDGIYEDYVKTEKSVDDIHMIDFLAEKLQEYKQLQEQDLSEYKRAYSKENWVHAKPLGDLIMHPDTISEKFHNDIVDCNIDREMAGKEPLPMMVFHDLRHAMATLLYEKFGIPRYIIAEILRHSDPNLSRLVYTHPTVEIQKEPLENINRLLRENFGDKQEVPQEFPKKIQKSS